MKEVTPEIILLKWDCPYCENENDLEAGVIWSYYGDKKGQPLILECLKCGKKAEMNLDEIDI